MRSRHWGGGVGGWLASSEGCMGSISPWIVDGLLPLVSPYMSSLYLDLSLCPNFPFL